MYFRIPLQEKIFSVIVVVWFMAGLPALPEPQSSWQYLRSFGKIEKYIFYAEVKYVYADVHNTD